MLYPIIFKPILKEKIWGGDTIKTKFGRQLPSDNIGESWDISCHGNDISVVANGMLKNKNLKELIDEYGRELLGHSLKEEQIKKFPLLIKILDAKDILSVQVHPDDDYAAAHENGELGKNEMWYIIDAKPGAMLIYGIKDGLTRDEFRQAIETGSLERCLKTLEVQAGDVVYIPAGMVHAIGDGILLCEIQQSSDTTYRVYDWNRLDDTGMLRELHIEKALDVIDFEGRYNKEKLTGLVISEGQSTRNYIIATKYFAIEVLDINGELIEKVDGSKFYTLSVMEGSGEIKYSNGKVSFSAGQSILIPACMGDYTIWGDCIILKAYMSNIDNDIINPLINKGYTQEELSTIAGLDKIG